MKMPEPHLPPGTHAVRVLGVVPPAAPAVAESLARRSGSLLTVVLLEENSLIDPWSQAWAFYGSLAGASQRTWDVLHLPHADPSAPSSREFEMVCDRATTLTRLLSIQNLDSSSCRALVLLTTAEGLFQPIPSLSATQAMEVRVRRGQGFGFENLKRVLAESLGYDAEAVCETPGQFAVRGGLLDVYPINASGPVRIDFFGDEVDRIRTYHPTTQESIGTMEEVTLLPLPQASTAPVKGGLMQFLGDGPVTWVLHEPSRVVLSAPELFGAVPGFGMAHLLEHRKGKPDRWYSLQNFDLAEPLFSRAPEQLAFRTELLDPYRVVNLESVFGLDRTQAEEEGRRQFFHTLETWDRKGCALHFAVPNDAEREHLATLLQGLSSRKRWKPRFLQGALPAGFRYVPGPDGGFSFDWAQEKPGLVIVTASEFLGRHRLQPAGLRRRLMPQKPQVDHLLDFSELAEGDYLVHLAHGICVFRGLAVMDIRGRREEVVSLEFEDSLVLHLPLHESHLLSRYVGLSRIKPRLAKLGGPQWEKTRRAAETATLDYAASLLSLQAQREQEPGHAFAPDTAWQSNFEESFPHRETPHQLQAIADTKADMERPRPMDRLICGDVGYGKTEVALRAAFKAVMDGRQVAVLVPTTVLAQQHFQTFRDRMAGFPITIEMVSRFRHASQVRQILDQTAEGRIDIVVGTHRLLSRDVRFARLGLLIIDEEHRFGVRHKERMKEIRTAVDVLTMSATPIPRTLYLALMGARDLSVIETPPVDRLPIETIVRSYSPEVVRQAIEAEINRGGQVFYLHNRVQTIDACALALQAMLPEARIAVGHGQMPENTLERIMTRFVAGEFDVLVCTTIIESGLDIPNCNTLIIEGADRFGLAQLYQIRGRVGRFNRQAYAYLLLHRHARLIDQARDRLAAIRQHNQLGAGFRIAMRDLELRGSGNLLGHQQSGHIAGVGFDLYCQLLRQSIGRLRGDPAAKKVRASVRLDFVTTSEGEECSARESKVGYAALREAEMADHRVGPIAACLPSSYINEARLRIDFYRRLALADSLSSVVSCAQSLEDRFGPRPASVEALLAVTRIRLLAEQADLVLVETEGNQLRCLRASGRSDDFIKVGHRFPRLTVVEPLLRLHEICQFIQRHISPTCNDPFNRPASHPASGVAG